MTMKQKPNFTPRAQQAIRQAKRIAKKYNATIITLEHLLFGMLDLNAGIVNEILYILSIDSSLLKEEIESQLSLDSKNHPPNETVFDEHFTIVLKVSASLSEKLGHEYVGLEHILLSMLKYSPSPTEFYLKVIGVSAETVIEEVRNYLRFTKETGSPSNKKDKKTSWKNPPLGKTKECVSPYLDKFASNLNSLAQDGKFDKIIGKDREINDVCEILCRRIKNNPILLGDPGVGKTAIVEGLAQRICAAEAPDFLLGKTIYGLDLGALIAGTKYRGQFEDRLKKIMDEAKKNPNIILFVDEIHTLIGAGAAEGSMDAANMLKPLLARGEIKCIGATTQEEYKKSILKDGALDRRFQAVGVIEPTISETKEILKGIRSRYEEFHGICYSDQILDLITELASKYILDKQFPDKAIDIMDQVGSKVKIKKIHRPEKAKEIEHRLEELAIREADSMKDSELFDVHEEQVSLLDQYESILSRWVVKYKNKKISVCSKEVYEVVSSRTGIPVQELSKLESKRLLGLKSTLNKHIIGQSKAIEEISNSILRSRSGLKDDNKPIGSFLLLGPTGTGKTYISKMVSQIMFGGSDKIIQLDMSEYSEKISSSRMVGAAPGYVGHEEGGVLTEKIRKNPYSVVLFDEIDKAHPDVVNMLLQVLEEGFLTDSLGRQVSFRNSIIMLTGNVGAHLMEKESLGFMSSKETETPKDRIKEELKKTFKPEFLSRLSAIISFKHFDKKDMRKIVRLEIKKIQEKLNKKNITIKATPAFINVIAEKAELEKSGARPVNRMLQKHIENELSELILNDELKDGGHIIFSARSGKLHHKVKEE
jgi:ATP-dependent Clp protease ATP-binding subunit ClpC